MVLRSAVAVRVENMTTEQRKKMGISVDHGLAVIETHNPKLKRKAILLKEGEILKYILSPEN